MIKTRTSVSGEEKVICSSMEFCCCRYSQAYHQHICFFMVVVWKRVHISVTSFVACRWGNNHLEWIFVVVQGFLSQVFYQTCLCLIMWQESTQCDVLNAGLISDLILHGVLLLSSPLPRSVLRSVSPVCVKDNNDLVKVSSEIYQCVIEAHTDVLHCHHSCHFLW